MFKYLILCNYREYNDRLKDHETIHRIKMIHLPRNSGYPYTTEAQKTDLALLELEESVNTCVEDDRDCWHISPVRLHDTPGSIQPLEEVRTLGKYVQTFNIFLPVLKMS